MPRPRKCRRVCSQPRCTSFGPSTLHAGRDIVMSVDEYEAIRLIDYELNTSSNEITKARWII